MEKTGKIRQAKSKQMRYNDKQRTDVPDQALEIETKRIMSTRDNLPEVVRIKRKRNQDSLQALILEAPRNKKIKDAQYVFKLRRTDNEIVQLKEDGEAMLPLLQESSGKKDKEHTFILPKEEKQNEKLPEQFTEMLDSVLSLSPQQQEGATGTSKPLKKRKHRGSIAGNKPIVQTNTVDLEYVYDVYYRDRAVHETWEKEKIGYIKFEEDKDDLLGDGESDKVVSDDEDSNAEDFYRNDYPDDEDDYSEADGKSESSIEVLADSMHRSQQLVNNSEGPTLDELADEFDDLYDELYDDEGNGPSDLLEDDHFNEEQNYPRQYFFPGEEDDDLAMHRDKIFDKLQRMIDEEN